MIDPFFSNKKILVLSPQPWNYFFVSKHHYAMELAKNNDVWFLSSPKESIGFQKWEETIDTHPRLKIIQYKLPIPAFFRFHINKIYRFVNLLAVKRILRKINPAFDVCIDFGCYSLYDSVEFIDATTKIFFPVDNFGHINFTKRGAHYLFTVSDVIRQKFIAAGIQCLFINHGLSENFITPAKERLQNCIEKKVENNKNVGYSGNLFIRFLNREIFRRIISENTSVVFHLFGSTNYNKGDAQETAWFHFLQSQPNVTLHGFMKPDQLALALQSMDALLLCYKADNKDYFGENTHKMLEYLSTGKAIISSHITLYAGSDLIEMTDIGNDEALPELFKQTIKTLELFNTPDLSRKRIIFALDNSYGKQVSRIGKIIAG